MMEPLRREPLHDRSPLPVPFLALVSGWRRSESGPHARGTYARSRSCALGIAVAVLALFAVLVAASRAPAQVAGGGVVIDPPAHGFGEVDVGAESDVAVFLVTNTGDEPVTVQAVSLGGSDPDQFTLVEDLCTGTVLPPRGVCEVWVRFTPTSSGEKGAVLEAATTGGAGSSVLTGTGRQFLEPPPDGDPPRYDLFLRHFLLDEPMGRILLGVLILGGAPFTEWQGELALPLVRAGDRGDPLGVRVARIPSPHGIDLARSLLADVLVRSDPASERESLPTTLDFATEAPLQLTGLSLGEAPCRLVDDGPPVGPGEDVTIRGRCDVDPIAPGDVRFAHAAWEWGRLLSLRVHGRKFLYMWNLECKPPTEWDCSFGNHTIMGTFLLAFPPRSRGVVRPDRLRGRARGPAVGERRGNRALRRLDAAGRASGAHHSADSTQRTPLRTVRRADRPARVDIALVRLAKGQRGFRGAPVAAPPDLGQAESDGERRCLWLANRKRKFKKVPAVGRVCDKPAWLRAKLRSPRQRAKPSRWRFRLAKRLRPGRYVLYSRATTRRGMPEMTFTNRRGNRVPFRVTKRGKVRSGLGRR